MPPTKVTGSLGVLKFKRGRQAGGKMKKSLLAGVSLGALALASGAQAADMAARPVYKAPVVAPVWSWTGFYVGANVGFARARTNISNPNNTYLFPGASFNSSQSGVIGGLEAGYNWQFNSVVVGLEGDISAASLGRSTSPGPIASTRRYVQRQHDRTRNGARSGRLGVRPPVDLRHRRRGICKSQGPICKSRCLRSREVQVQVRPPPDGRPAAV